MWRLRRSAAARSAANRLNAIRRTTNRLTPAVHLGARVLVLIVLVDWTCHTPWPWFLPMIVLDVVLASIVFAFMVVWLQDCRQRRHPNS